MTFTQAIKEIRILAADDITDIVADFVTLKRSGSGMKGYCPFHEENTPSFHVSDQKGIYKCFGCGIGGDAIDFLMRMEGKEFHEVIYKLANRFHLKIDKNSNSYSTSNQKSAESLIPGIKKARSEIRKSGQVFIGFKGAPLERLNSKAKIEITSPLNLEQAKILKRYTSRCVFVPGNMAWESIKDSLVAVLATNITALVWEDGNEYDWIQYLLKAYGVNREEVIQLIAIMPESISRSVYMTYYSELLNKKIKKKA